MAIPITFIQAVGQPVAAAFMQTLTNWRIGQIDRHLWLCKVSAGTVHRLTDNRPDPTIMSRSAFYNALVQKCNNLYGGAGTDADPLALARHPWSLTAQEFEDAYEVLTKQKLPDLPDDRKRFGATASFYGSVSATAGIILNTVGAPITVTAIGLAGALTGIAAAGSEKERENAQARQKAQIRENFSGFLAVYQREALYRTKEVSV